MNLVNIIEKENCIFRRELVLYERLRQLGRILNVQILEPIVSLVLVDGKTGKVKSTRKRHSWSFTRNLHNIAAAFPVGKLTGSTYADGSLALKRVSTAIITDTIAVNQSANFETAGQWLFGADDDPTMGTVAGRDNTAESIDDFEMGNLITSGTGPNQLEYQDSVLTEGWNGGSSYYWAKHSRPMDNNSAGSITVEEVGIILENDVPALLLSRDLIAGGQIVAVSDRLFVEYEFRASF